MILNNQLDEIKEAIVVYGKGSPVKESLFHWKVNMKIYCRGI